MDPLTAAAGLSAEVVKSETVQGLLTRALGPAADEIGLALARWTSFRVGNVERIALQTARLADKRGRTGSVPARVAHRILGDGSWSDDPVMVEYLSGVLASSRTPTGRDDRAVVWSALIASMSTFQLRAHYLLYRQWSLLLRSRPSMNLMNPDIRAAAAMCMPLASFTSELLQGEADPTGTRLSHTITGLGRLELIEGGRFGTWSGAPESVTPERPGLLVYPSVPGIELFCWSQGLPDLAPEDFGDCQEDFELPTPLAPLVDAYLPAHEAHPE